MILGLDFYDTITENPKTYKQLAKNILDGKGEVYIISAIKAGNEKKLRNNVRLAHVPHTKLEVLIYSSHNEVPGLKKAACQRLRVDIMIDDRTDVREALKGTRTLPLAP